MMDPCAAHACAACCHETEMPLTEEDARRLESLGHARAAFSLVTKEGTLQLANVGARSGSEGEDASGRVRGACFFLRDDRCSVYAARPAGCRTYPFVMTPEGRVVRDHDCPWRNEFPSENGTRSRLLKIVSVVQRETAQRRG